MLVRHALSTIELRILQYYKRDPLERSGLQIVGELYARKRLLAILFNGVNPVLFGPSELLNLWQQARLLQHHGGAFAEVGAFEGDSAEIVCKAKGDQRFYVFEAFAGLRNLTPGLDGRFRPNLFSSREETLRRRLQPYPNTVVIAGYFPETADPVDDQQFSYVHIDVDVYEATREALRFFYPRLLTGGRIIAHDYSQCRGVWKAVDEFLTNKSASIEVMGTTQAVITKHS